jgi:hypothetical protein
MQRKKIGILSISAAGSVMLNLVVDDIFHMNHIPIVLNVLIPDSQRSVRYQYQYVHLSVTD